MYAEYKDTDRFAINAMDSSGSQVTQLVNTTGGYGGMTYIGTYYNIVTASSKAVTSLDVRCDGEWTITLSPIYDAPTAESGETFSGDQVVAINTDSDNISFSFTGDHDYMVWGINESGMARLMLNMHGTFSTTFKNSDFKWISVNSTSTEDGAFWALRM
jgi:hypothetical protein